MHAPFPTADLGVCQIETRALARFEPGAPVVAPRPQAEAVVAPEAPGS